MNRLRTFAVIALVVAAVPASAAKRVRISVMTLFHPQQFTVESTAAQPLVANAGEKEMLVDGEGGRVTLSRAGQNVRLTSRGQRLTGRQVSFTPQQGGDAEFVLSVPGKLRRSYRGRLTVINTGRELLAVVDMDLETAVASIVAAEMPDVPLEALRAQAVAVRSYLIAGEKRHAHVDFCDTTHCQFLRSPPPLASSAARATAATEGLVLAWKGKPFAAMYSAACGGRTRSATPAETAGGDYPYFAVDCRYCRCTRQRRGHGVGLCQNGAAGMARDGKSFRQILAHYFPNTTIESLR